MTVHPTAIAASATLTRSTVRSFALATPTPITMMVTATCFERGLCDRNKVFDQHNNRDAGKLRTLVKTYRIVC